MGMRDTPPVKAAAVQIHAHALGAIESLTAALDVAVATGDADLVDEVKRGAGISIGTIDTRLLSALYRRCPDLDHRKR